MQRIWTAHYDRDVPPTLSYPDFVVPDLLTAAAKDYPSRPALRYYGATISYSELDGLTTRFAQGLTRLREGARHDPRFTLRFHKHDNGYALIRTL